jgi:hypothetical protein
MHAMTGFSQRALIWAFTVMLALGVSACSSEATERKTFIEFLQTRIVDKPGVHLPRLSPAEEKSFGEYSKHFAVIRDFNAAMDSKVTGPMRVLLGKGMPRSMPEIMSRRADLATLRETSVMLRASTGVELAKANTERAALKQPDDLKAVYDKAYARTVTEPAEMVNEFMPAVEATLASAEKLAAYLEAHKDQVKFRGSMMEVSDPKVLAEANVLVAQMTAKNEEIMAAQRKMNTMMSGR